MRKLLLAGCALGLSLSPALAQTTVSSSASSGGGQMAASARVAVAPSSFSGTSPYTGTGTAGSSGTIVVTQVNPGSKPGQAGVAASYSGGITTATNVPSSFGGISSASTISMSLSQGMTFNGGSFNVGSSVTTGVNQTTTTGFGGPGTTIQRTGSR